jgi:hypothetical protein
METAVTWSHNSDDDKTRQASKLFDEAVLSIRNRGHTTEHALCLAAKEFGIRLRRAKALLYGEPVVVLDDELARIRAAFLKHLETDAEYHAARSAASRERLRRMEAGDS